MRFISKFSPFYLIALRWTIAAIFAYHGWQKVAAPEASRAFFESIGFPAIVGPLMGWVEMAVAALLFTGVWKAKANW